MFSEAMYSTNLLGRTISKVIFSGALSLLKTLLPSPLVIQGFFSPHCSVVCPFCWSDAFISGFD